MLTKIFSIFKKQNKIQQLEDGIWIFENFISREQCVDIVDQIEKSNFKIARQYKEGRHNKETFLHEPGVAVLIKDRLKEISSSDKNFKAAITDVSLPLEFYKYETGDFIKRHSDAPRELNGKYSKLTLVLYLSDNCKGGETFFDKYGLKINPTSGVALLFNQELNHEALIVTEGVKYVLRTNCFLE